MCTAWLFIINFIFLSFSRGSFLAALTTSAPLSVPSFLYFLRFTALFSFLPHLFVFYNPFLLILSRLLHHPLLTWFVPLLFLAGFLVYFCIFFCFPLETPLFFRASFPFALSFTIHLMLLFFSYPTLLNFFWVCAFVCVLCPLTGELFLCLIPL